MKFTTLATIASTLLFAANANADTCNPLKSSDCSPVPALGSSFLEKFDNGLGPHFESLKKQGTIDSGSNGLSLTMKRDLIILPSNPISTSCLVVLKLF